LTVPVPDLFFPQNQTPRFFLHNVTRESFNFDSLVATRHAT
jgi:hypothetical protein